MFLIAAVLQVGGPVLIPFVIYVFATASTAKAVAFSIWCIVVVLMGQRAEAAITRTGPSGSHPRSFPRRDGGNPGNGHPWTLRRPHHSVGWIQAIPGLAGRRHGAGACATERR
jgi:hypothetical protein